VTEAQAGWATVTQGEQRADAFRRLADGQLEDAYRLASAILGGPNEARDVVHDAFIAAWQAWPTLRDQDRFGPWFRRIVVNACRDRLRRATRRRTSDLASSPEAPALDTSPQIHDRLLIEAGLARLRPDDRILLALRYYHDLKVDDIAVVLDIPAGTVKSRLSHAHARLRSAIEQAQPWSGQR
jgi:RNA polymerase sigma-70 factor, ECF subfamily